MKIEKYMETVQNFDLCRNMNENGDNGIKWKKPVSEREILYVLFHISFLEKQKQVCTYDTVKVKLRGE